MCGAVEQSMNSGCQLRFDGRKACWQREVEAEAGRRVPRDVCNLPGPATHCRKWHFWVFARTLFISFYVCDICVKDLKIQWAQSVLQVHVVSRLWLSLIANARQDPEQASRGLFWSFAISAAFQFQLKIFFSIERFLEVSAAHQWSFRGVTRCLPSHFCWWLPASLVTPSNPTAYRSMRKSLCLTWKVQQVWHNLLTNNNRSAQTLGRPWATWAVSWKLLVQPAWPGQSLMPRITLSSRPMGSSHSWPRVHLAGLARHQLMRACPAWSTTTPRMTLWERPLEPPSQWWPHGSKLANLQVSRRLPQPPQASLSLLSACSTRSLEPWPEWLSAWSVAFFGPKIPMTRPWTGCTGRSWMKWELPLTARKRNKQLVTSSWSFKRWWTSCSGCLTCLVE